MSKTASPTLIGLFTLAGLLLAAGSLMLFGASRFFEKTSRIMLYFDQSANGLLVGSEARFGGVRIGRVASIRVLVDSKENRKIIPVVVELSEKDLRHVGSTTGDSLDFTTDAGVQADGGEHEQVTDPAARHAFFFQQGQRDEEDGEPCAE